MKNIGEHMIYLKKRIKDFIQDQSKKVEWLKEKFDMLVVFIFLFLVFTIGLPIAMMIVLIRLIYDRSFRHEIFGVHIRQ